jgi:hypothetical protein
MLKRDNIGFGILIGSLLPLAFYGILLVISQAVRPGTMLAKPFEISHMMLIALIVNVFPIRLYFVTWKLDRTGRGVLLMTFVLMAGFFIFNRYF